MRIQYLLCSLAVMATQAAHAFDVNAASAFELESLPGIGQKTAQKIIEERQLRGAFKSWLDFQTRVQGFGDTKIKKIQNAGLTLTEKPVQKISESQ